MLDRRGVGDFRIAVQAPLAGLKVLGRVDGVMCRGSFREDGLAHIGVEGRTVDAVGDLAEGVDRVVGRFGNLGVAIGLGHQDAGGAVDDLDVHGVDGAGLAVPAGGIDVFRAVQGQGPDIAERNRAAQGDVDTGKRMGAGDVRRPDPGLVQDGEGRAKGPAIGRLDGDDIAVRRGGVTPHPDL